MCKQSSFVNKTVLLIQIAACRLDQNYLKKYTCRKLDCYLKLKY